MRILEIVDVRWWNACAYYGVELAHALRKAGEDVVVAAAPASPPAAAARALGLPVWSDVRMSARNPLRAARDFARLCRRLHDFDLIDAHRAEGHLWAALASAWAGGPPVVRTRGDIRPPRAGLFGDLLQRRLTAGHVVPGDFMRRHLIHDFALPAARVALIPAGIDLDHYAIDGAAPGSAATDAPRRDARGRELRHALGIGDREPVAGIVARLSPVKGHKIALGALAALDRAGLGLHLLVAGQDAELRARDLAGEAAALGLGGRVHWLGFQEDVRAVLSAVDVLVVASLGSEAISRVVLEGMAMSRAVIGTRVGVVPELIQDGETGRLVPPGDESALAAALAPVCTDLGLARAMGVRGRARAEAEYGIARWVERTLSFYRRVVMDHGRRGGPPPGSA